MRKSFTLPKSMAERVSKYATQWGVTESETLRRLFGLGSFVVEELNEGNTLYSENKNKESMSKLAFPELGM